MGRRKQDDAEGRVELAITMCSSASPAAARSWKGWQSWTDLGVCTPTSNDPLCGIPLPTQLHADIPLQLMASKSPRRTQLLAIGPQLSPRMRKALSTLEGEGDCVSHLPIHHNPVWVYTVQVPKSTP